MVAGGQSLEEDDMSTDITWLDIALRLGLTIVAGALIGLNRGEHGLPAGLRTTLLVCLAASLAMIQANILMASAGKPADSFVTIDLMRLPLGILSGMGFIGGGVILKRENLVLGVTTAATLWFVTVLGLCFGGGQLLLGSIALAIGVVVLRFLKTIELRLKTIRRGTLAIAVASDGPSEADVRNLVVGDDFDIVATSSFFDQANRRREWICEVRWHASDEPLFLKKLELLAGVKSLRWSPQGFRAYLEE
jgi:putative Mg2+ transporter-C (MgtC) family protein